MMGAFVCGFRAVVAGIVMGAFVCGFRVVVVAVTYSLSSLVV